MENAKEKKKRPNFLIIVADDLGYSDIAPYGGEIDTPNLSQLAKDGIRLTNFHTASACSPTRAMLFSGTDNHICGLGQMDEYLRDKREYYKDKPGYEGYLNWRVAALSEILQDAGYHTGPETTMAGESQLADGIKHPPCIKTRDFWMGGDEFIKMTDLPDTFYSTTSFTDKLLEYLKLRHQASTKQGKQVDEKPFFAYLPFMAPHWPLQAPREVMKKYEGVYDDGPDALTQKRLKKMKGLGIIAPDVVPAPPVGLLGKEWDELTPEERKLSARKMETFAAMVDMIDTNVGRVVEYLKSTGELDNTMILFMSDNGAEGAVLEAVPLMGGPETFGGVINDHYDNRYENIGNKTSFVWYGPRWACAASAPSRAFKTWITEGGIRCPCIVHYSPLTAPGPGTMIDAFTTVMDILPTILDLADVPHPGSLFRGRPIEPIRGKSWLRLLSSASVTVHGEDTHVHGWELFGQQAIRRGCWKAVWIPAPRGKDNWELYDLARDPAEMKDLAAQEPEVLAELLRLWEEYYAETGMTNLPGPPPIKG